ncbi:hypothetical protein [Paraflavitalea speifideaquila]|uniref:hypothetical protein n=1 Tax=Paraflavitalea speifideaquila TaxID=3076558 RepID=UPI0028EB41AD|nr:hypothetical protein [Paraflavitalea speifideiaquila]
MNTGQINRLDELLLIFNDDKVFINSDATTLQIGQLDFPVQVERFKPEITWKIRVLNYDDEKGEIIAEIIDYAANPEPNTGSQISLQFESIEKIRFRSIDTPQLLHAIELKRSTITKSPEEFHSIQQPILKKEINRNGF